jgi:hypothetical protein
VPSFYTAGKELFDLDGELGQLRRHEGQLLALAFQLRVECAVVAVFVGAPGIGALDHMGCRAGMPVDELQIIVTAGITAGELLTFRTPVCHNETHLSEEIGCFEQPVARASALRWGVAVVERG